MKVLCRLFLSLFVFIIWSLQVWALQTYSFKLEDSERYKYKKALEKIVKDQYLTYAKEGENLVGISSQKVIEKLNLHKQKKSFLSATDDTMQELKSKSLMEDKFLSSRKDLRYLDFITVDNIHTISRDQAIYIEKNKGIYKFYYALADVTSYFPYGSSLDVEASFRQLTTYPYGMHTYRMIPQNFSTQTSSLEEDETHRSFVVELDLEKDKSGFLHVISSQFYRALVQNRINLDFETVEKIWAGEIVADTELPKKAYTNIMLMKEFGEELKRMYVHKNEIIPSYDNVETRESYEQPGIVNVSSRDMLPVEVINQALSKLVNNVASESVVCRATLFKRITAPIRRYTDEMAHRLLLGEKFSQETLQHYGALAKLAEEREALISRRTRDYMMGMAINSVLKANRNPTHPQQVFSATIVKGDASKEVDKDRVSLKFKDYPFVISYPMKDIPETYLNSEGLVQFKVEYIKDLGQDPKISFISFSGSRVEL